MFVIKKQLAKLDAQLRKEFNEDLTKKLNCDWLNNYVECSTCGCLVKKEKAEKVQSMVNKTEEFAPVYGIPVRVVIEDEKEIKTSYYCKHCYETKKRKK